MFWTDQIAADIEKAFPGKRRFILRDEKTPSGTIHIGSLRGVVIHGVIAQALREKGSDAEFYYEINDADPMDGLPTYLSKKFEKYMGKPLKDIPAPDSAGEPNEDAFAKDPAQNYAKFFGKEFIEIILKLGFSPEIRYSSKFYSEGKYNDLVDIVLENPEKIRKIYKEVSGSEKGLNWNPVQIVCEKCGKVGTTTVVKSEGERGRKIVEYICEENKVVWAKGCGYKGKASPYDGRGKLPWKVEWSAKWEILKVDIEGAGKDHAAAGGSHDIAERITKEVFKGTVPFNIPYEHFLLGGAKMSSSKAIGASAKEVADILPPELLRFLMVRSWPNQTIDFDPSGETIPRLFDKHDEAANAYFKNIAPENVEISDLKRAYYFSQLDSQKIPDKFFPRFSRVAFILQIPNLDFWEEMGKLKGSALNADDRKECEMRKTYAKMWLKKYANEAEKFVIQENPPEKAEKLTVDQKKFLRDIADMLSQKDWKGEELHTALHDLRKKSPLQAKEAFQAIYIALLGKDSGPQAGWFLEALDKEFVIKRFKEI